MISAEGADILTHEFYFDLFLRLISALRRKYTLQCLPHRLCSSRSKAKLRIVIISSPHHLFAGLMDIQLTLSTPLEPQGPIYAYKNLRA